MTSARMGGGISKVVEEWHEGNIGFVRFSSGLIITWGAVWSNGDQVVTVTLPKVYTDLDSMIVVQSRSSWADFSSMGNPISTTQINVGSCNSGSTINWICIGY